MRPTLSGRHEPDTLQSYRFCPALGILTRDYGDDCAVYLSAARETHLLSATAVQVLALIEENSQSSKALLEAMKPHFEDASGADVSDLLDEVVEGLSRIGVIEAFEDAS